jgi:uncharacterized protein YndB with AHSA1/START domain
MTSTIAVAPIRKRIRVNAAPARAFEIFTEGMIRWWSKNYTINKSPMKEIVIEPRSGGRWFERGEDGSECQWGKVLAWEPPVRLLLAWQIAGNWQFDPDLVTELEIRFTPEGSSSLVELEHRNLERLGAAAEGLRETFDSPHGWMGLLESFAARAG